MSKSSTLRAGSVTGSETNRPGRTNSVAGPLPADILAGINSREFYAAAISDALDSLGYRNHGSDLSCRMIRLLDLLVAREQFNGWS